MRALCWHGKGDIRCDTVPDPTIEHGRDAIIKVTSCAICGSDLHLFDNYIPYMERGDILGHEFMGEVVAVGKDNRKLKVGDRVVVPFTICCGECYQCKLGNWSCCQTTNRDAAAATKLFGQPTAGLFGYSHITGHYAGGQAEYVRVPYADVAPFKVDSDLTDDQLLFLTDIFPTGWQAAAHCDIGPEDVIANWGCGPVGQFSIRSAQILGAKQVIAIDNVPERLAMAKACGATTINFDDEDPYDRIMEITHGRGADAVIDSVGMEAHVGGSVDSILDKAKAALMLEPGGRAHQLREMMQCVRPCGIVSVPGVYGGAIDKFPIGHVVQKGLTIRSGQTHVPRYLEQLMGVIRDGKIDPSFVVTHRTSLEEGPEMYKTFRDKQDGCIKVVMDPAKLAA